MADMININFTRKKFLGIERDAEIEEADWAKQVALRDEEKEWQKNLGMVRRLPFTKSREIYAARIMYEGREGIERMSQRMRQLQGMLGGCADIVMEKLLGGYCIKVRKAEKEETEVPENECIIINFDERYSV